MENFVTGTEGRAVLGKSAVLVTLKDGTSQEWPHTDSAGSGMDRAAAEIVDWLDGETSFPYDVGEAVRTLEVIVGFHASHARGGAWVRLPPRRRGPRDCRQQRLRLATIQRIVGEWRIMK